ncbi:MAG: hypothetical protein SOZ52_09350 [Pyramidobacter sp.]|nr:hypothetical protein [Pyramidobacter sp.]
MTAGLRKMTERFLKTKNSLTERGKADALCKAVYSAGISAQNNLCGADFFSPALR